MLKILHLIIIIITLQFHHGFSQLSLSYSLKTYTSINSVAASRIANKALKIKEPHSIGSFYLNPRHDTLWVELSLYVHDSMLDKDKELLLYDQSAKYVDILSKSNLPPHPTCIIKVSFYDRKMGSHGMSLQWLFTLKDKKAFFTEYIPKKLPRSTDQNFWARLKNYQLPSNTILLFDSDTTITILHFEKDSAFFPKQSVISDSDSKETFRLIYEVLGPEVKKYAIIEEGYFDPLMNYKTTSFMLIKELFLDKNPLSMLFHYRQLFPERTPYCGKCD